MNIFAYCSNNVINKFDPSGRKSFRLSECWFAVRHPVIARQIGQVIEGKRCLNISTTAVRFAIGLGLKNPDSANKEGTQVNALRHTMWTGIILSKYGPSIARDAVRSHEDRSLLYVADEVMKLSEKTIQSRYYDSHKQADGICDVLNNEIALSMPWSNTPTKQICKDILTIYYEKGLWVIDESVTDGFRITRQCLSDDEYNTAMIMLENLDEYGFSD